MAGEIVIGTVAGADQLMATFSILYNDQNQAISFSGTNLSASTVAAHIVGLAADGTEDAANKTFALLLPGNGSDFVTIPVNGPKAIPLTVNAKGHLSGFNSYLGF